MKNRLFLLMALIVAVTFLVGASAAPPQRWVYHETCTFKDLNDLGADGWELVSATTQTTDVKCFYLKRRK